jgi:murein DD-endopeptidase MepM/ murein hydrolase activator NlpD
MIASASLASLSCIALLGAASAAERPPPAMLPPVAQSCITSPFGPRRAIGPQAPAAFHRGVDLRAPAGAAVTAVAPGRILAIHRRGMDGMEVAIRHDGYVALYAHLGNLAPPVALGRSTVKAGDRIAVVGRTGVTYGTHLYFEILVDGQPVDPEPLLGLPRCG